MERPAAGVVEARGLEVRQGGRVVLEQVDLTVAPGSFGVLLGPPGAGKSTLLRALLGLVPSQAHTLAVLGLAPGHSSLALRARVGYVSPQPAFYPHQHALGVGRFLSDVYPRWDRERYAGLLARLGIPPREPSGGLSPALRARLALAAALAHRPELVLIDVPDGLDAAARQDLLLALEEESEGLTVLLAAEEPVAARRASRVTLLVRGRVRWAGAPGALLARAARVELEGFAGGNAPLPPLPAGLRALGVRPARGPSTPGEVLVLAEQPEQLDALVGWPALRARHPASLEELYPALAREAPGAPRRLGWPVPAPGEPYGRVPGPPSGRVPGPPSGRVPGPPSGRVPGPPSGRVPGPPSGRGGPR